MPPVLITRRPFSDGIDAVRHLEDIRDETFIHHTYVRCCRRICVPEEARDLVARLNSGVSRNVILQEIEALARLEGGLGRIPDHRDIDDLLLLDGDRFIRSAYRLILGRAADPSGLDHYLARLDQGDEKVNIILSLLSSSEAGVRGSQLSALRSAIGASSSRLSIEPELSAALLVRLLLKREADFVRAAYLLILGRRVDRDGMKTYGHALRVGVPKVQIVAALLASGEGRERKKTFVARLLAAVAARAMA